MRERGGTAFTATEKEVFGPIMPELNKDEKTNLNRINRMLEIMEGKRSSFLDQFPGMIGNNQQKSSQKEAQSTPQVGQTFNGAKVLKVRRVR